METLQSGSEKKEIPLGETITLQLEPSTTLETDGSSVTLKTGTMRIAAERLGSVKVEDLDIFVLGGSAFVMHETGSFVIAALDGPLLVSDGILHRLLASEHQLVFNGARLETAALSPLPGTWLAEQKSFLPPLELRSIETSTSDDVMHGLAMIRASEQLPTETRAFFAALHDLNPAIPLDGYAALRLLALPQSAESNDILASILAVSDADALSWSHGMFIIARQHLLPDLALEHLSKLSKRAVVERPAQATSLLLPLLDETILNFERQGFPIYTKRLKAMKQEFMTLAKSLLGPDAFTSTMETVQQEEMMVPWADQLVLEQQARSIFTDAGVDATVETACKTLSAELVRCTGLYFSGATGDRLFDATLHLPSQKLLDIVLDGTSLPNALSLGQFLQSL